MLISFRVGYLLVGYVKIDIQYFENQSFIILFLIHKSMLFSYKKNFLHKNNLVYKINYFMFVTNL